MALTDNPYLQLYVRDWMTSNKLSMCSPSAHGILVNILCILHRENLYGRLLLRQKFKQTESTCLNFANQLSRMMPFTVQQIADGLDELVIEGILEIDGDFLVSKKLETLAELSEKRSAAGKKGGKRSRDFAKANAKANSQANTEIEIETDNETESINNGVKIEELDFLQFWEDYGYNKDKESAAEAWSKLSKKDRIDAINYVPEYLAECKRLSRPLRYPATYLNRRTWENEIENKSHTNGKSSNSLSEKNARAGREIVEDLLRK